MFSFFRYTNLYSIESQNTSVDEGFACLHFEYRNLAWARKRKWKSDDVKAETNNQWLKSRWL